MIVERLGLLIGAPGGRAFTSAEQERGREGGQRYPPAEVPTCTKSKDPGRGFKKESTKLGGSVSTSFT